MISEKIKILTNSDLRAVAEKMAGRNRELDALLIEHIAEIADRRVFHEWGFSSLYDYLTRELKYSGSAAYRRMQAAYALLQIPELKQDIALGSLNLTQICSAQTAIKFEQKNNGPVTLAAKRELFTALRHKNKRETEKVLDEKFENRPTVHPVERHRADDSVELSIRLPEETFEKLSRLKELYSHMIPDGSWIRIIDQMAEDALKTRDPLKKPVRLEKPLRASTPEAKSMAQSETAAAVEPDRTPAMSDRKMARQAIRANVKRFIFQRDRCCQFRHQDGSICGSRFQLEIDHIQPKFADGEDEPNNLRLLCRSHNSYRYHVGK